MSLSTSCHCHTHWPSSLIHPRSLAPVWKANHHLLWLKLAKESIARMRWLNIHVLLWFNILRNDVWTFWPEVIGSNHTLTPITDRFDLWMVESDELLTQRSSFICQKKLRHDCLFQHRPPGALPKATYLVTDSSFHPPPSGSKVWHHSINNGAIIYDLLDWWIRLDRKEECTRMIILHWQTLMTSWGVEGGQWDRIYICQFGMT